MNMKIFKYIILLNIINLISCFGQFNYLPADYDGQVIKRNQYTLCYCEDHEQAAWVAYVLEKNEVYASRERTDDFRPDNNVTTRSASLSDYKGSGYDRGHLSPAADNKISHTAMSESFYLSNMSPQLPGFNRGIWRSLESDVRGWAIKNKKIYVVTGPIFKNNIGSIGINNVTVPGYYYKVILDYDLPEKKAIGFILPHKEGLKNIKQYACSIDKVESVSGIDFFSALPDQEENELEASFDVSLWPTNITYSSNKSSSSKKYYTDTQNKIDVNTASKAQLDKIKYIGPAKAQTIIDARPYRSVNDITRAKGIGKTTLERIRPYVRVE